MGMAGGAFSSSELSNSGDGERDGGGSNIIGSFDGSVAWDRY